MGHGFFPPKNVVGYYHLRQGYVFLRIFDKNKRMFEIEFRSYVFTNTTLTNWDTSHMALGFFSTFKRDYQMMFPLNRCGDQQDILPLELCFP